MASGKNYNSIDTKQNLLFINTKNGVHGGYKQDLLVNNLNELEKEFFVCTKCNGLMRNACIVGIDQNLVCEICIPQREKSQPMIKSRKKIVELSVKCPLQSRDCEWQGNIGEIHAHLNECTEFIVECLNKCGVILKRSELMNHCESICLHRNINCKYCEATMQYREEETHYKLCPEFPLVCPNECSETVLRRGLESHIEKECSNTIVSCPYKEMGCEMIMKRCEAQEHVKTFESLHFSTTVLFYSEKVEKMEIEMLNKEKEIGRLNDRVKRMEINAHCRERENIRLAEAVQSLRKQIVQIHSKVEGTPQTNTTLESKQSPQTSGERKYEAVFHEADKKEKSNSKESDLEYLPKMKKESLKIGFLHRYIAGLVGRWEKNLVVLGDGAIYYYDTATDHEKATDILQMSVCEGLSTYGNDWNPQSQKPEIPPNLSPENGFVIFTRRFGSNYFVADSLKIAKEWMQTIKENINKHSMFQF